MSVSCREWEEVGLEEVGVGVVWWELDSECGGMYDLVCADLVVMLLVMFDSG